MTSNNVTKLPNSIPEELPSTGFFVSFGTTDQMCSKTFQTEPFAVNGELDLKNIQISKSIETPTKYKHKNVMCKDMNDFSNMIDRSGYNKFHLNGRVAKDCEVGTKKKQSNVVRDNNNYYYDNRPGILAFDFDVKDMTLNKVKKDFYSIFPEFIDAPSLWKQSTSNGIQFKKEGKKLYDASGQVIKPDGDGVVKITDNTGFRLYIAISDMSILNLKREGTNERSFTLWAKTKIWNSGHGFIEISKAPSKLVRGLIDFSVYDPNRLDFLKPNLTGDGLYQNKIANEVLNADKPPFNLTKQIIQVTDQSIQKMEKAIADAKEEIEPEYRKAYNEKLNSEIQNDNQYGSYVKSGDTEKAEERAEKIKNRFSQKIKQNVLSSDETIYVALKPGQATDDAVQIAGQQCKEYTVGYIMEHRERFHAEECMSVAEPEYGKKGILYLTGRNQNNPIIFDQAHGGITYKIVGKKAVIHLINTDYKIDAEEINRQLSQRSDWFRVGNNPAIIEDVHGEIMLTVLKDVQFRTEVTGCITFLRTNAKGETYEAVLSRELAVAAKKQVYKSSLRELTGLTNLPLMDSDGNLHNKIGYNGTTKKFYHNERKFNVPDRPTFTQVKEAFFSTLNYFKDVPFGTTDDQVNFFSMMITSVMIDLFDAYSQPYPAFLSKSPKNRAGKTKLLEAVQIVHYGKVQPTVEWARDDDENKKMIASKFRAADGNCLFIDNIKDGSNFISDTIEKMLSGRGGMSSRTLGGSELITFERGMLVLVSGKHTLIPHGMSGRVLVTELLPTRSDPEKQAFNTNYINDLIRDRHSVVEKLFTLYRYFAQNCKNRTHYDLSEKAHNELSEETKAVMEANNSMPAWSSTVGHCVTFLYDVIKSKKVRPFNNSNRHKIIELEKENDASIYLNSRVVKYVLRRWRNENNVGDTDVPKLGDTLDYTFTFTDFKKVALPLNETQLTSGRVFKGFINNNHLNGDIIKLYHDGCWYDSVTVVIPSTGTNTQKFKATVTRRE